MQVHSFTDIFLNPCTELLCRVLSCECDKLKKITIQIVLVQRHNLSHNGCQVIGTAVGIEGQAIHHVPLIHIPASAAQSKQRRVLKITEEEGEKS